MHVGTPLFRLLAPKLLKVELNIKFYLSNYMLVSFGENNANRGPVLCIICQLSPLTSLGLGSPLGSRVTISVQVRCVYCPVDGGNPPQNINTSDNDHMQGLYECV